MAFVSGALVMSANSEFDFTAAVMGGIEREQLLLGFGFSEDVFGLSLPSSPEPTPPPSLQPGSATPLEEPASARASATIQLEELFSLSPLSSPDPPPPPSPCLHPTTPAKDSSTLQLPPLPSKKQLHLQRIKALSRTNHAKSREKARTATYAAHKIRSKIEERYVKPATAIQTDVAMNGRTFAERVASTAFVAIDDRKRSQKVYNLEDLVGDESKHKFRYVAWDGTPAPLSDSNNLAMGVLAGQPNAQEWQQLMRQAAEELEKHRGHCFIPKKIRERGGRHRRGKFIALQCGISHGGGQPHPKVMEQVPANAKVLGELNRHEAFIRIAGFASSIMATWAPDLYSHYCDYLGRLHAHDPKLQRPFPSSVFTATTYNFGPQTACFPHYDFNNLPFGWCSITALGNFDPRKGGHLVLWDLHLVIEFPPGMTILIPSAILAHSNVRIQAGETRYSVVHYTAGALFRWVENGFQKSDVYLQSLTEEQLHEVQAENAKRWEYGLSLFRKLAPSTTL
ncbi:hypothetical protein NLJ89_g11121 [Agrocybe chaxingu]|uniref:Uncharacterized protein n=1 Tax=Agrocybe chaxingu TaxID=84603 RepID=A0A9W8JPY6_9AGAR|nr:hypothetical protein NLJ89_g11121 [Agrocybe chaxingu]